VSIGGEGVLGKIIGTDTDEVDLSQNLFGLQGSSWSFDHDADGRQTGLTHCL
jgi:hypothetical protein